MSSTPEGDAAPLAGGAGPNESSVPNRTPESEMSRYLRLMFRPGDVFEMRVFKLRSRAGSTYSTTASGYFTFEAIDAAVKEAVAIDRSALAPGVYVTLNPVQPDLLARAVNRVNRKANETTGDEQVIRRTRLLIDADPERAPGTSSTDAELKAAEERIVAVVAALRDKGWPEPLVGMSGNGAHAIYAIDLPADDGGLVERVLAALHAEFGDDKVKIDTSVYNPARITKLLGTVARKGDDLRGVPGVEDRPHRRSRIVSAPESLAAVPRELLEALAAKAPPRKPKPENKSRAKPSGAARPNPRPFEKFEHTPDGVADYLARHQVTVAARHRDPTGWWLYLDRCPVVLDCPATGRSDIGVWVGDDGALGYSNRHDRGQGLRWLDLREALEPGYREYSERKKEKWAARADGDDDDEPDWTQRDKLVILARERYRFGRTEADEPFAVVIDGPNVARLFRGSKGSLRSQLAWAYMNQYGKAPSSSSLADAMMVLEGDALLAEPQPVHLRLARHGDAIVLDLGDSTGRAVIISTSGWEGVERSPVLFRRTPLTAPLPIPVRGGSIEQLRALVNVSGTSWPLAVGMVIASFIPDMEHPIVLLGGQQDAGKSTAARFLAGVTDPSTAALRAPPRDVEQWAVTAVGSWVVVVDNISGIAEWLSDAFCRAVTGDGLIRRALFTNDDLSVLVFQRCLILTSIDAGGLKGDLGRRLIMLDLEPINKKRKRRPRMLKAEYEAARPAIVGAFLDLLVRVLAEMPLVELDEFHGLADFEHVLAALDRVLGTDALDQYRAQWTRIAADVVEGDLVARAVQVFAEIECRAEPWVGTAGELLKRTTQERPAKGWPDNPKAFAGALRRAIPVLAAVGIEVTPPARSDKSRRYELRLTAPTAQPPENSPGAGPVGDSASGDTPGDAPVTTANSPSQPPPSNEDCDRPENRPADSPTVNGPHSDASEGSGLSGGSGGSPRGSSTHEGGGLGDHLVRRATELFGQRATPGARGVRS